MNSKEGLNIAFENLKNALKNNDLKALDRLIATDYKGFTLNGTIEVKEDIIANFRPGLIKITKYEVSEMECETYLDIGIISGKGKIAGSYKVYHFQHEVLFIDIFKYVIDKWLYYKSQVTEIPSK